MLKCIFILYLKFTNFLCQSRMQDQFVGWMLYHAQDQGGKEARSWPRSRGQGSKIMAKIWGQGGKIMAKIWGQGGKIIAKI